MNVDHLLKHWGSMGLNCQCFLKLCTSGCYLKPHRLGDLPTDMDRYFRTLDLTSHSFAGPVGHGDFRHETCNDNHHWEDEIPWFYGCSTVIIMIHGIWYAVKNKRSSLLIWVIFV